jgi:hypothetical protein
MVNIAAFQFVIGNASRATAEFKPVCAILPRDIACSGRQRWQETAKSGKVSGKNGMVLGCRRGIQARVVVGVSE